MKIIELIIDEKDEMSGIEAVSVVHSPAIEENFVALKKHELELKTVDKEKRILMGAALIPNKHIYRVNEQNEEYYIYFSSDTVRKASELFLMRSNQNNATLEHESKLQGMSVVESWIIEDEKKDKSNLYGFSLPKGTWMISMKVNNDKIWNDVKEGKVKGFSIEGYFADKLEMSLQEIEEAELIEQIKKIILENE
jgi:Na+-transporting NADH:ubiquinone oxidoreductase subunit NqrC